MVEGEADGVGEIGAIEGGEDVVGDGDVVDDEPLGEIDGFDEALVEEVANGGGDAGGGGGAFAGEDFGRDGVHGWFLSMMVGADGSAWANSAHGLGLRAGVRVVGWGMRVTLLIPMVMVLAMAGAGVRAEEGKAAAGEAEKKEAEKPAVVEAEKKAAAEPGADPTKAIESLGGSRYRIGLIEFDKATRVVSIPAVVNMNKGLVEYLLVHESGKVHESLFSTKVRPMEFNVALLLLDWKASGTFFDYTEPERGGVPVKGATHRAENSLTIHVRCKDENGKEQTVRIEEWLHNLDKKAHISEGPFIYTGSRIMPDGSFLAQDTGSIVALMVDPASIVNNPREGNELDDIWVPDPAVPAKGTAVTIELRPVAAGKGEAKGEEKGESKGEKKPAVKPAQGKPAGKRSEK